jgi:hypothetical protein
MSSRTKGGTVIFSRNSGSGGRHAAGDPRRSGRHAADRRGGGSADAGHADWDDATVDEPGTPSGPYDIEDAPSGQERVDLGSLQIPAIEGVEVRVQANADGIIQQVVLAHGGSALQLGVFAAPRNEGIWDEVRGEIRKQLFTDGVAVEESQGGYGTELRARVRTADGLMDLRFIGVDGPRWMVRAVYQGAAAIDPEAAGPLSECLRGLVVDRGREAMPVREALPLRLPRDLADHVQAQAQANAATVDPGAHAVPSGGAATNGAPVNGATAPGRVYGSPAAGAAQAGGAQAGAAQANGAQANGARANGTAPGAKAAGAARRPSPRPRRSQ